MTASIVNQISELSIPADAGEVRHASAWLGAACIERGVPQSEVGRLELCLNEALANVIDHSGADPKSQLIHLSLEVNRNQPTGEALVTISDFGAPFNPLATPARSQPKTLAEAEPGGLGLIMIRAFSDSQRYHYIGGCNQLTFGVCWTNIQ